MSDKGRPVAYVALLPILTEAAQEVGYALAVHGSLARDLDLVAIPWVEDAVSAQQLMLRLLSTVGYRNAHIAPRIEPKRENHSNGDEPERKPHGRLAWTIHFENGLYLDVSVMPRGVKEERAA